VLAGFGGVALLLGVDLGGEGAALLGGLAVVLAALGYAIGGFLVKHKLAGVPPIGMSAAVLLSAAVLMFPVALAGFPESAPGLGPAAAIFVLGVLGTGFAWVIFYGLIATIGPARAFIVTYIAPGFAIVYGAVFLDEAITASIVAGLALILAGSWLAVEGRLPWRPRPPDAGQLEPVGAEPVVAASRSSGAAR
jgi:drug/metabolite transporter (DMT)-like permease